jgi:hypothetical protein
MKTVSNSKHTEPDGVTIYYQWRLIGVRQIGVAVAVSPAELRLGRAVVAHRLRRARRELAELVALAWHDQPTRSAR